MAVPPDKKPESAPQQAHSSFDLPAVPHRQLAARAAESGGLSFNTYDWDFAPYMLALKERISRNIFPPLAFSQLGMIDGDTMLRFKIYPDGRLADLELLAYTRPPLADGDQPLRRQHLGPLPHPAGRFSQALPGSHRQILLLRKTISEERNEKRTGISWPRAASSCTPCSCARSPPWPSSSRSRISLRRRKIIVPEVVSVLENVKETNDFGLAVSICEKHHGPFANIIRISLENHGLPREELKETLLDQGRQEVHQLEKGWACWRPSPASRRCWGCWARCSAS